MNKLVTFQSDSISEITNNLRNKSPDFLNGGNKTPPLIVIVDGENNINSDEISQSHKKNIQLRVSHTNIHNNNQINGLTSVAPFLGDEKSLKYLSIFSENAVQEILIKKMPSFSLQNSSTDQSTPLTSPFPISSVGDDFTEFLSKIPLDAWILPFIISYFHDEISQVLEQVSLNSAREDIIGNHTLETSMNPTPTAHQNDLLQSKPAFIKRIESWKSLGTIYMSSDPSRFPWERRRIFLCDNYLFELSSESSQIVGYCQLFGAEVERKTNPIHTNSASSKDEQLKSSKYMLKVNFLKYSRLDSPKITVWILTGDDSSFKNVENEINKASALTVDSIYDMSGVEKEHDESSSLLGRGRFNEVHRARRKANTKAKDGDYFALKLVSKEIFWERVKSGKERADALVREVISQAIVCRHSKTLIDRRMPSTAHGCGRPMFPVVQIFGAFETIDGFALELELMQHKDLFDKLSTEGLFTEEQVQDVVCQLVEAVLLCWKCGIAHRDIKLSNITFPLECTTDNVQQDVQHQGEVQQKRIHIKLADFGMAGFQSTDGKLRGRCGTPGYVAPDILRAGCNESYSLNVDMFSVGVVAYILLCGYEPFYGTNDEDLIRCNKHVEYEFQDPEWSNISANAKDWIARALSPTAHSRMNPESALLHPWLNKFTTRVQHL